MTSLRVLVVDDEPLGRRAVRQLLSAYSDVEVLGEARNGREAIRLLRELKPDLVFLDVQMPEVDGFAVLRGIDPDTLPLVVFVTAFDSFAVRAFEMSALDYLVKPLHEQRFREALSKARERLRSKEAIELSKRLVQLLSSDLVEPEEKGSAARVFVGTIGGGLFLDFDEIDWICAEDYYSAVHCNGQKHLVRESLSSFESRLDRSCFLRVHRKTIVNLKRIDKIVTESDEGGLVILRDGTRVSMSRRLRSKVSEALSKHKARSVFH